MGKSAPSAPPPPDYAGAAAQTAAGNLEAARSASAANRLNQYTPYGSLEYTQTPTKTLDPKAYQAALSDWRANGQQGAEPDPNQYMAFNPDAGWAATQKLSPEQQQLLDYQNKASIGLGELTGKGLGYVSNMLENPFDTSKLPTTGFNPSQSYQDAYMQRLKPQIEQGREALSVQLANQGIPIGSEAYNRAMLSQGQKENDLLAAATTQGFGVGQQARQQGLQEQAYLRNEPLNTLNAVRTGAQVQGPSFVNSAQQATTAGPDMLGAAQMGYNANLAASNAKNAASNSLTQGLFSLGGAGIMAMSDIRTKQNIEPVGVADNGLTVYKYEYKPEFKDHELAGHGVHYGYMAQEVEQVFPYAVKTLNDGYKVVDYGQL
jgi:hypothetical protein